MTFGDAMVEAALYARLRRPGWHANYYWAVCLETGVLMEYRGGVALHRAEVTRDELAATDWVVCAAIHSEDARDILTAA